MQYIIAEALKAREEEAKEQSDSFTNDDIPHSRPRIVVVGCGNAGNTTVHRLSNLGVPGAETIAVNSDKQHLEGIRADKRVLIGKRLTKGLGAGGFADVGKRAAQAAGTTLSGLLNGADLVILTAGVGWGVGTGATPVIAELAREQGAATLAIVSAPFAVEMRRQVRVGEGLAAITGAADTTCVIDYEQLHTFVPNLPLQQAYAVMDQLIAEVILHLCAATAASSLVPIPFSALRAYLEKGGCATLCIGGVKDGHDADRIVTECLNHPLLGSDCRKAKHCLLLIIGGDELSRAHAATIAETFREQLGTATKVTWGALACTTYGSRVRAVALFSEVEMPEHLLPSKRPKITTPPGPFPHRDRM
jgi:cell division protein FtsZ